MLFRSVAYEDRPLQWDAWDIDIFYEQKPYPVREILDWRVAESGPLRATVAIVRRVGQSTITQRISLWRDSRRVDFATEVDWHERQTLLRETALLTQERRAGVDVARTRGHCACRCCCVGVVRRCGAAQHHVGIALHDLRKVFVKWRADPNAPWWARGSRAGPRGLERTDRGSPQSDWPRNLSWPCRGYAAPGKIGSYPA